MAHVKNVGGGPGDDDPRPPPRQPTDAKGKATKKLATKKRKYPDADTARAAVVAEAVECVERGGARSGVVIADQLSPSMKAALEQVEHRHGGPARTIMLGGRRVAIDESQPQGGHSRSHSQQRRLRRESRPWRQSRHLSHSFAALVIPVL